MEKKIQHLLNEYDSARSFFFAACDLNKDFTSGYLISALFDDLFSRVSLLGALHKRYKSSFSLDMYHHYLKIVTNFDSVERTFQETMSFISSGRKVFVDSLFPSL